MNSYFKEEYSSDYVFFEKRYVREEVVLYRTKVGVADLLGFEFDCFITFHKGIYEVQIEKWIGGQLTILAEKGFERETEAREYFFSALEKIKNKYKIRCLLKSDE